MKKDNSPISQLWVYIFLVNVLVIYLASVVYPSFVVLGNNRIYSLASLILASLILTLILSQVRTVTKFLKLKIENNLTWFVTYAIANTVGLWLIARGAYYTGFGVASVWIAIAFGIVLSITQYGVFKIVFGDFLKNR